MTVAGEPEARAGLPTLDAMSHTTRRPRSTVRHALWLGGLLVVLGGLFGMHGLDNHGGAGLETVGHAGMAMSAHGAGAGQAAMTAAAHPASAVATVTLASSLTDASGHTGIDMVAAGMCMAVLVLSLLALVLRSYASRPRPLLWLVARPARAPAVRGRDPDPPSQFGLSVQRC
jgi:hypothetical protein